MLDNQTGKKKKIFEGCAQHLRLNANVLSIVTENLLTIYDVDTHTKINDIIFNSNSLTNNCQLNNVIIQATALPHIQGNQAGIILFDIKTKEECWVNVPFQTGLTGLLQLENRRLLIIGDTQIIFLHFGFGMFPDPNYQEIKESLSQTFISKPRYLQPNWWQQYIANYAMQLQTQSSQGSQMIGSQICSQQNESYTYISKRTTQTISNNKCTNKINWHHEHTPLNVYMMRQSQLQLSQNIGLSPPLEGLGGSIQYFDEWSQQ
ncbi:Hypothetical_protein [Hexamita inflata]|uniref:Hypothetical_protein n=1 Tax=Hexamita inflata TaxID=28002 RepID=A0AA86N3Y1_9EUKA|nr:Hypothetical protein HINF_LOCUS202 [Hexamita inflata]